MGRSYDAIVIGAGLGGLSAATMLARYGLKVLLLERHNLPGGYATSFVRGRYELEVALHELSGIGPPEDRGGLYKYLDELGVAADLEFLFTPNLYRAVFPDLDVTLPAGRGPFEDKLCELFPKEAKGIRRHMERVWGLWRDLGKVFRERGIGNPLTMPKRFPYLFRYMPSTYGRILDRDVKDPLARAVISQYWGYVGLPPSRISFLYFAVTLAAYVRRGAAFPRGRSQALSQAFLSRFEALGGDARLGTGVRRITTENGRVTGVITEDEEAVSADFVVSNADPVQTCVDLLPEESVDGAFFRNLRSSKVAASTVNVYLGVDRPHDALGLDEHEIFVSVDADYERHALRMEGLEPPESIAITTYNTVDPTVSPPGTSLVVLTALSYGEPWYDVDPHAYVDTKNRIGRGMLELAERVAPELRRYAEVVEVSTPLTNMRYASTLGGSIYGFEQPPRDNMLLRMPNRGPLEGLYFAGAWTQPGGGFEPAMSSGRMAGGAILARRKKMQRGG